MANKKLFNTGGSNLPETDTVNNAGGKAYKFEAKHCLAQIAATNTFNGTFYANAEDNLRLAKDSALALKDDPEFIAKVALYSRQKAYMKDMPAFLTVMLSECDKPLFRKVFNAVVDNGKMLRNVIQMARSGAVTGKKANMSAGTWRKAIQNWFDNKSPHALFKASIGNDPNMRDILRMARPKPNSDAKQALYGYFVGKEIPIDSLPEPAKSYELYKKDKSFPLPDVDFRFLDSLGIGDAEWTKIANRAPWMMTRMNLNSFASHNVFKDELVTEAVAERLKNKQLIEEARAFPYQLFVAWREVSENSQIPFSVKDALQDAMEISIENVPALPGNGLVCVDTSGSMGSPITGYSPGRVASKVTCCEVAGLIASAVNRKNRNAEIYTFNDSARLVNLNPRDTVFTNTKALSKAGGGTDLSAPLVNFNERGLKADWVLYVSDYESWIDPRSSGFNWKGTSMAEEWKKFKKRNPKARLVCCDLTPRSNTQIQCQPDVLQVGGFSDQVFDVIASFLEHGNQTDHWVKLIEQVEIPSN